MNSEILSKIKNKLKPYISNKEIYDIILFGSVVKGKIIPNDIDIAIISDSTFKISISNFHIIFLKPKDFFVNPPLIVSTLLKEGYSLKNNMFLSERYKFQNKALFNYELSGLSASDKVRIVNVLRGKNSNPGLVEENNGAWLANQVFIIPIDNVELFTKFFVNFKVKFKMHYILMH